MLQDYQPPHGPSIDERRSLTPSDLLTLANAMFVLAKIAVLLLAAAVAAAVILHIAWGVPAGELLAWFRDLIPGAIAKLLGK